MNSRCSSQEGGCCTCEYNEDLGIDGAPFNSKVEAIADGYNQSQRQYYESLLVEAKSKVQSAISEVVEKGVASRKQDKQCELEKCHEEKNAAARVNSKLIKTQNRLKEEKKVEEKKDKEREATELKLRDEKIGGLGEQIRDITIRVEAKENIDNMEGSSGIKQGTLLSVEYQQPSSASKAKKKKKKKPGQRRN